MISGVPRSTRLAATAAGLLIAVVVFVATASLAGGGAGALVPVFASAGLACALVGARIAYLSKRHSGS
jgi:hypothetical protein